MAEIIPLARLVQAIDDFGAMTRALANGASYIPASAAAAAVLAQITNAERELCLAVPRAFLTLFADPYPRDAKQRRLVDWVIDAVGADAEQSKVASAVLAEHGVRVVPDPPSGGRSTGWLEIANTHPRIAGLWRGLVWSPENARDRRKGARGPSDTWISALRRVPGAAPTDARRFAGYLSRGMRLPLEPLLAELDVKKTCAS